MNMKMNMKMPKLSQQAMIVAFAAALPVLAYEERDARDHSKT